jgi:hypothetical protein
MRTLLGISVLLGALCLVQWTTLQRLKNELAEADARAYRAMLAETREHRDEVARTVAWIDGYSRAEGQSSVRVLCDGGTASSVGIADAVTYMFLYLGSRKEGASEAAARQNVLDAMAAQSALQESPLP